MNKKNRNLYVISVHSFCPTKFHGHFVSMLDCFPGVFSKVGSWTLVDSYIQISASKTAEMQTKATLLVVSQIHNCCSRYLQAGCSSCWLINIIKVLTTHSLQLTTRLVNVFAHHTHIHAGWNTLHTGLRAARSEISGPNFFKFQDNFRTLLSVSRGTRHRKCTFFCAHKC